MAADDGKTAALLVRASTLGMAYADELLEAVHLAANAPDVEIRALVAENASEIVGVALYGRVAGTVGTARVRYLAVSPVARRAGVGAKLCNATAGELERDGARLLIVEMPGDSRFDPGRALLKQCGYVEEGRVADFYADGVALVLLRRDLSALSKQVSII